MRKIFKRIDLKTIVAFVVGGVMFGGITVVVAGQILASQVSYTKNGQSTVDGALDTLYTRSNKWLDPMNVSSNYIFSDFDGVSRYLFPDVRHFSDTPPSGETIYIARYYNNELGVCIKKGGTEHCFRLNDWHLEYLHMEGVFSSENCIATTGGIYCHDSEFYCYLYGTDPGEVSCFKNDYHHEFGDRNGPSEGCIVRNLLEGGQEESFVDDGRFGRCDMWF